MKVIILHGEKENYAAYSALIVQKNVFMDVRLKFAKSVDTRNY